MKGVIHSHPPSTTQEGWETKGSSATLSLARTKENLAGGKGLVSISAHWSWPGICWTTNCLATTFSQTKKTSSSMCLVLAWRTGLWARLTALRLSHSTRGMLWARLTAEVIPLYTRASHALTPHQHVSTFPPQGVLSLSFFCLSVCSFHKWTVPITCGPLLAAVKPSFIQHDHTARTAFLFSWVYHFCNKFGSYDIYAPALEGVLDYILLKPTQRLTYRVCCVSVCIPSRNY